MAGGLILVAAMLGCSWQEAMSPRADGWRVIARPPAKAEVKTCLCSPLCVCGCNAGEKCQCQAVRGPATHQGDARPVVAPIIRMLVPGGVRSGNC
jgi:hypothetical protein